MSKRMLELLKNAARCFEEGYSPLCHSELTKMNVTFDECMDLSDLISEIVKEHIREDVEENRLLKYLYGLDKSQKQIAKTRDIVVGFGMDHVTMPGPLLKTVIEKTDRIREDFGFLMNFVRLDVLRQITAIPEDMESEG